MEKVKHYSLFSGIESFKKAMTNLGIENELVGYSEFDKYASVALSAIHGVSEELNYGDITKIDETKVPDCDLITYGFPCQDISVAGLGKGIIEGETRSGLLYDALRIIKYKKPKYAIAENVKNLVGKKFIDDFNSLLEELDSYGYNNYWKVLNAKDYGIPQNRERVFIVSIRKDVDNDKFEFPKPFDSGLRLKDLLEEEVEDKYYIENDRTSILLNNLKEQDLLNGERFGADSTINDPRKRDISNCIIARYDTGIGNQKQTGLVVAEPMIVASRGRNPNNPSDRAVGSPTEQRLEPNSQGITNTLTTVQKDNLVIEPNNNPRIVQAVGDRGNHSYSVKDYAFTIPANPMSDRGQMVLEPNELKLIGMLDMKGNEQVRRVYNSDGISPTLNTMQGGHREPKVAVKEATKLGYAIASAGDSINLEQPNSKTRRGRVGKEVAQTLTTSCNQAVIEPVKPELIGGVGEINFGKQYRQGNRIYDSKAIAMCLLAQPVGNVGGNSYLYKVDYRVRKLTPKECWRLMGFTDEDYRKARQALENRFYNGKDRSNSQMYKMAGNSIVVDVLEGILKNLIK